MPKPTGLITSPVQVRSLRSPARQEIVDALDAAGPCSVARLGDLLGRAPDGLYFHLRRLTACGLVVERPPSARRRQPAVYDLPSRPARISYDPPVRPADVSAVVAASMRLAVRDFRLAMLDHRSARSGAARELWGGRFKGWVPPAKLRRINTLLAEIRALVHSARPAGRAKAIGFSFILAPATLRVRRAAARNTHRKGGSR